jgi:hypothetical protein
MYALTLMLKPIPLGWAATLTDGREIVRFHGPWAKRRLLRYLAAYSRSREVSHVG